jgi:hypothetical protein
MTLIQLEKLWLEFVNIPIDSNDEIETDFQFWKTGTNRFEIWDWFDNKLPNGLIKDFNLILR